MNCREKILSEDYMSILLDYLPEEADQAMEIASARHKRTAPPNQRGEIADLRCVVIVVEDLQPLGPEV